MHYFGAFLRRIYHFCALGYQISHILQISPIGVLRFEHFFVFCAPFWCIYTLNDTLNDTNSPKMILKLILYLIILSLGYQICRIFHNIAIGVFHLGLVIPRFCIISSIGVFLFYLTREIHYKNDRNDTNHVCEYFKFCIFHNFLISTRGWYQIEYVDTLLGGNFIILHLNYFAIM